MTTKSGAQSKPLSKSPNPQASDSWVKSRRRWASLSTIASCPTAKVLRFRRCRLPMEPPPTTKAFILHFPFREDAYSDRRGPHPQTIFVLPPPNKFWQVRRSSGRADCCSQHKLHSTAKRGHDFAYCLHHIFNILIAHAVKHGQTDEAFIG